MYETLISAEALLPQLDRENYCLIDCRFDLSDLEYGRKAHRDSHIPGASYAHLEEDLSGPIILGRTGRHPLPTPEAAEQLFRVLGVARNSQVVLYDDKGGAIAARAWWLLKWLGHSAAAVLDGGWQRWQALGYPTEDRQSAVRVGNFVAIPHPALVVEAPEIDQIRLNDQHALVDSRTAERYRGEVEPIDPVAGHIEGALNLPFPENLTNQQFKEATILEKRFQEGLGAIPAERTIFYCGSGVTACHNILAHAQAGRGMARLYPGSWSEWIVYKNMV